MALVLIDVIIILAMVVIDINIIQGKIIDINYHKM